MPNWVQLVAYTAEHTPGPFYGREYATVTMNGILLYRKRDGKSPQAVALVYDENADDAGTLFPTATGVSVPTEATARLFIDAPEMLTLLARWANKSREPVTDAAVQLMSLKALLDETENVIRRHVRLGCAPVDEESRTGGKLGPEQTMILRWDNKPEA